MSFIFSPAVATVPWVCYNPGIPKQEGIHLCDISKNIP